MQYVDFSWSYDFPSEIEEALECDYVYNHHLYSEASLKCVAALLLVAPDAPSALAVSIARAS